MQKLMRKLILILPLFLLLVGCKNTLAPGGAYAPIAQPGQPTQAPDMTLFVIDSAYKFAWTTINTAFDLEKANRALLFKASPDIKHTLDRIRPQAKQADLEFITARTVYLTNPVPGNLDALNAVLAKIQQLTAAAIAVVPQAKGN
jgi:hypothetical protein